jgi:hypothetical protein
MSGHLIAITEIQIYYAKNDRIDAEVRDTKREICVIRRGSFINDDENIKKCSYRR